MVGFSRVPRCCPLLPRGIVNVREHSSAGHDPKPGLLIPAVFKAGGCRSSKVFFWTFFVGDCPFLPMSG